MKAINTKNIMKHLVLAGSMLLFLLVYTENTLSQETLIFKGEGDKESAGNQNIASQPGVQNTMLFNNISTELGAEVMKSAPEAYEEGSLISYSFPREMFVEIKVYDKKGKQVAVAVSEALESGSYSNDLGKLNLKEGEYYYKLVLGENITVKKFKI